MERLPNNNNLLSFFSSRWQLSSCASRVKYSIVLACLLSQLNSFPQRQDISLNHDWRTIASLENGNFSPSVFFNDDKDLKDWKKVDVPHNWDAYEGYRRLVHGNRHGDAWYSKKINITQSKKGKRFFLFFEGVGSYAAVYLNNKEVGRHAGGRTSFTIDITDFLKTDGSTNSLLVNAFHPANINDLPWVCGGCSDERGFSEGSQPMGIFRPVHLIVTNEVRIEPFGIHAWADLANGQVNLFTNTTIKNYSSTDVSVKITHFLADANGKILRDFYTGGKMKANDSNIFSAKLRIENASAIQLWSNENPYLYKIISVVYKNGIVVDKTETAFGFRTISWKNPSHQFLLNNKPVFLNGIAEYEHLLGQSHAFSNEQIIARMKWIQAAGFNAFRDGHQPHNLLYGQLCNEEGILWWTQLSAHVWYNTPEFKNNFKQLLREWVIERRNDPSVILWGLQNESKLPKEFAEECTALIRSLDPTASSQRLVTTCNGGEGTDWDVPQNWTGTYGGNPDEYAKDIKKQVLIGEYGAWRTIDLHTEGGFVQNGILSEDRMVQLMEKKIRLAESVKDSCAGQFFWLLTSHDNPGRVQGGEGLRELDRIGPVNYKGLLTPWEEPTDAFYMFRSNYASKEKEPMVYIVSHTWPNRWEYPGIKDSIIVYSNCDEVELFNDIDSLSLGKRKRNGIGTHFQWDNVDIRYNVLYAIGYMKGRAVARDTIALLHLPSAKKYSSHITATEVVKASPGYFYQYRVNCGGSIFEDADKNYWQADAGYSRSWANDFAGIPEQFASQRRTFSPIKKTTNLSLFQTFRYGKDKLQYEFPVENGNYIVEMYFIEPWIGIGGNFNGKGMRVFDIAINGTTMIKDLDIWSEVGTNTALKKTINVKVSNGKIIVSFPQTKVGQALVSAIAIASKKQSAKKEFTDTMVVHLEGEWHLDHWLDIGKWTNDVEITSLPPSLYGASWPVYNRRNVNRDISFEVKKDYDVFVAIRQGREVPVWMKGFEDQKAQIETVVLYRKFIYQVYKKRVTANTRVDLKGNDDVIFAFQPATTMQPAFDLKKITQYKSNVATGSAGVVKENFTGRECMVIKTKDQTDTEWPILTGVADIYSITVKYFWGNEKTVTGRLQLIGPGNTMMLDEQVSFTFTREGKWNQFTINTGTMINAGNYKVRLLINDAQGLTISGIDIQ